MFLEVLKTYALFLALPSIICGALIWLGLKVKTPQRRYGLWLVATVLLYCTIDKGHPVISPWDLMLYSGLVAGLLSLVIPPRGKRGAYSQIRPARHRYTATVAKKRSVGDY